MSGGGVYHHIFFFSSRRRHTRLQGDWSSDVCSSDLDHLMDSLGVQMRTVSYPKLQQFHGSPPVDLSLKGVTARAQTTPRISSPALALSRSEERRVGKECRSRWSPYH